MNGLPENIPQTGDDAPDRILFAAELNERFHALWSISFPKGVAQEAGGTLVRNSDGTLSLVNEGTGTQGTFPPNREVSGEQRIEGIFHTHPYADFEGGYTDISLSGADAAYMINQGDNMIMAQSGEGQFLYLKTEQTPSIVDYAALNNAQNQRIGVLMDNGIAFDVASRIAAKETAIAYTMAYYEGSAGILRRISP